MGGASQRRLRATLNGRCGKTTKATNFKFWSKLKLHGTHLKMCSIIPWIEFSEKYLKIRGHFFTTCEIAIFKLAFKGLNIYGFFNILYFWSEQG